MQTININGQEFQANDISELAATAAQELNVVLFEQGEDAYNALKQSLVEQGFKFA